MLENFVTIMTEIDYLSVMTINKTKSDMAICNLVIISTFCFIKAKDLLRVIVAL